MFMWLKQKKINWIFVFEVGLILFFALLPLFFKYPYRLNIYLTWEGAYRMSIGQIPYKDFGLPMGFGFWLIPATFLKIFGPAMINLVKAQAFINILAGFSFFAILKILEIKKEIRFLSLLIFCLSYTFFNFWPWYNHTVIVFQLISIAFVLAAIFNNKWKVAKLAIAALFIFLSIFTKQDGGGLGFLIIFSLLIYHSIIEREIKTIGMFLAFTVGSAVILILPFINHDFFYWFNYGQEPHNSRISLFDIVSTFFNQSKWEKFYLLIMFLLILIKSKDFKSFFFNKKEFIHFLLTLGIIVQAIIYQVTSYVPADNNIFFHSFAFAYIFSNLPLNLNVKPSFSLGILSILIFLWWSEKFWVYGERILKRVLPQKEISENSISINTWYTKNSDEQRNDNQWVFSDAPVFKNIYMPQETVDGIQKIKALDLWSNKDVKVLNMSELTPLAVELNYDLPKQPLWFHKGVCIFDKEVTEFCDNIEVGYYDLVLFEDIPLLNNFYPYEVQNCLKQNYHLFDIFLAPRRGGGIGYIEVYLKSVPENSNVVSIN